MSTRAEQLADLWAQVPEVGCRGLCQSACGPIEPSRVERRAVEAEAGRRLSATANRCDLLVEGRCSGYAARPLICRLWGAVASMRCPYGCRPAAGYMSDDAALDLLGAALALGGEDGSEVALRSRRAVLAAEAALDAITPPDARRLP